MINCRLSNKLSEQNEQFKSSEHVHLKGVQLKRRAWYRQRHRKVIITVISSSLQWCSHSIGAHPSVHTCMSIHCFGDETKIFLTG